MTKQTLILIIFLTSIPCQLNPANVQYAQLTRNLFAVMDARVQFEQLRILVMQKLQQNRSMDFTCLRMMLDYYGSQVTVQTKNQAIEHLLKDHIARTISQTSSEGVTVLKQEAPYTTSQVAKFDFNVRNEPRDHARIFREAEKKHAFSYESENLRVSLDVRPISHVPSAYDQMVERVNYRNMVQQYIRNDPQLWFEYVAQRGHCIDLIKKMVNVSSNPDALLAQLCVNNLSLIDVFDEGAILKGWVRPGIQNMLFKNGNFVGIDNQEKLGKFLKMVDPFFKAALGKEEYIQLLQEYKAKAIPGAQILLNRALGLNSYWDAFKNCLNNCLSFYPYSIDREIADSRMIKNCADALALCKADKFDEARKIVSFLRMPTNSKDLSFRASEAYYLSALIENEYSAIYNPYGVRYTDTADPYYAIAKSLLDSCSVREKLEFQKVMQENIAYRSAELSKLLAHAHVSEQELSYIKAVGYKILDAQDNNEIVDILSCFAKDHADPQAQNAYKVFVSKGLPRCLPANECTKNVSMPASIELQINEDARKLFGYCAGLKIEAEEQKELINRALLHIERTVQEEVFRQEHLSLARHFYTAARDKNSLLLKLPHLIQPFKNPAQNVLRKKLFSNLCDSLDQAENDQAVLATVEKAQKAWAAIQSEQIKTLKELEELWNYKPEDHLLSATSEIYPEKEIEKIEEEFKPPYGCGNSFVEKLQRALIESTEELFKGQDPYGDHYLPWPERAYNPYDPENHEVEEVIDIDKIPQCNGGQQTLPSFGEEKEAGRADKGNEKNCENEDSRIIKAVDNWIEEITKDKAIIEEQKQKIEEFRKKFRVLMKNCGEEATLEAFLVCKPNLLKILKPETVLVLKEIAEHLLEINQNTETRLFKFDAAHDGNITQNSIQEAIAGKASNDQGLTGKVKRGKGQGEDFEEIESGRLWDVKTARSKALNGDRIWNVKDFLKGLQGAYDNDENIMIQITNLENNDLVEFYKEYKKKFGVNEYLKTIIVDAKDQSRSKSSEDLIKFLSEI